MPWSIGPPDGAAHWVWELTGCTDFWQIITNLGEALVIYNLQNLKEGLLFTLQGIGY